MAWGLQKGIGPNGHADVGATLSEVAVRAWQETFRNLGGKGNEEELALSARLSWGMMKGQAEKWVKV